MPPGPAGSADRHALQGTKPAWTAKASPSGLVSKSQRESAKVWLAPRNAAGLAALAKAVSDPSSSQYHKFLTHEQYVAQFVPDAAEVSAVTAWLQQSKLKVTSVGADNHYLAVTGSEAAVTAAFGAQLGLYDANGSRCRHPPPTSRCRTRSPAPSSPCRA